MIPFRTTIMTLLLLISFSLFSNEIEIKLSKDQKVLGTFSGDIHQQSVFQAVMIKNKETKKYEIIPVFINEDSKTIILDKLEFKKEMIILSYHEDNDILTLLVKNKKGKSIVQIVDIDTKTKKVNTEVLEDWSLGTMVIRLNDKTILYNEKKGKVSFTEIQNITNIKNQHIEFEKESDILKTFFKVNSTNVNTNEYVENGSISLNNLYVNDENIYFTNYDEKSKNLNVLKLDLNNLKDFKSVKIENIDEFEKIKDVNSFIFKDNIITTIASKDDVIIKVINFDSEKTLFKKSVKNELIDYLDTELVTEFLKKSSKKRYKPTVTANLSVDNNIIMNVDFVDVNTYNYHYDWWFHHWAFMHQQMMFQQQQIMNSMPGSFGPNAKFDYVMFEDQKSTMQFVLNTDFELVKEASKETVYKNIDEDEYLEAYKKDKVKKHLTVGFTTNTYHLIYYSKKEKVIVLKSKKQY